MKKDSLLAIIAGAGTGSRYGSEIPKQYLMINEKSVIEKAVEPFLCSEYVKKIITNYQYFLVINITHSKLQSL